MGASSAYGVRRRTKLRDVYFFKVDRQPARHGAVCHGCFDIKLAHCCFDGYVACLAMVTCTAFTDDTRPTLPLAKMFGWTVVFPLLQQSHFRRTVRTVTASHQSAPQTRKRLGLGLHCVLSGLTRRYDNYAFPTSPAEPCLLFGGRVLLSNTWHSYNFAQCNCVFVCRRWWNATDYTVTVELTRLNALAVWNGRETTSEV